MSERKNLEESIASLQDAIDDRMLFRAGPHTRRVVDAARKHFETLPKTVTKYQVTRRYGLKMPPSCFCRNRFNTLDEAVIDALRGHPLEGFPDRIEIEKVEEPT